MKPTTKLTAFIRRFYKALTFTTIGLLFALHWAIIQRNASPADYLSLGCMVLLTWVLDFFNGRSK